MRSQLLALALTFSCFYATKADDQSAIYEARQGKCDYFVSTSGNDKNEGTDIDAAFETLKCACDSNCNRDLQRDEVICVLAGTYEVYDTIYVKGENMRERDLTIMALGKDRSVILDAMEQATIFNSLQTHTVFHGIVFRNGHGSSGGAVYGERGLKFINCAFEENSATVHGGAVMGGRLMEFYKCDFIDNSARFAGALRINDVGSAIIEDCLFMGNSAENRGGAIATQIEKPDEHSVKVKNTLFCFNESPMSAHIYNYRTTTHKCTNCGFNSKKCCSNHGRVVPIEDADSYYLPAGKNRSRVCECTEGWKGERCELKSISHSDL